MKVRHIVNSVSARRVRCAARDVHAAPGKAAAELRRAVELWSKGPAPGPETRFERSRALALLVGLREVVKSGVTPTESARFAD